MATKRKRKGKMPAGLARYHRARRAAKAAGSAPRKRKRKASKKARRASFRRKASGRIRPVVIVSGNGFRRPAKSKYFSGPTRINPRRRRKSRRGMRRNPGFSRMLPLRSAFSKSSLMHYVGIGGGIGLGAMLSRFLNTGAVPFMSAPPTVPSWVVTLQKARPLHGLIHILVGVTLASKVRNPIAKDLGAGLAALGGFDLLMQGLTFAGVKGLPTFSGMNVNLMGMNYDVPRTVLPSAGLRGDTDEFIDSLDT